MYAGTFDFGHVNNDDENSGGRAYDQLNTWRLARLDIGLPLNLAIVGYSWGGGATYLLAKRLSENSRTGSAPDQWKLEYTAYFDAFRRGSFIRETRYPNQTRYHTNQYLLDGNLRSGPMDSVSGSPPTEQIPYSEEIIRRNSGLTGMGHSLIASAPIARNVVINSLINELPIQ